MALAGYQQRADHHQRASAGAAQSTDPTRECDPLAARPGGGGIHDPAALIRMARSIGELPKAVRSLYASHNASAFQFSWPLATSKAITPAFAPLWLAIGATSACAAGVLRGWLRQTLI